MTADDALAEVRRLAGPLADTLIADARQGLIRPDDLLRWVQYWHGERIRLGYPPITESAGANTDGHGEKCQRCGSTNLYLCWQRTKSPKIRHIRCECRPCGGRYSHFAAHNPATIAEANKHEEYTKPAAITPQGMFE